MRTIVCHERPHMPRISPNIPSATDVLCESCGYVLNGLRQDSRCPECGELIAASTIDNPRGPSAWEKRRGVLGRAAGFLSTTAAVLFRPTRFYSTLITRASTGPALAFAVLHWIIASLLLGTAVYVHVSQFVTRDASIVSRIIHDGAFWPIVVFVLLWLTTRFAANLTAWEAAYRGLRLPLGVVRRAMYFHAAHYLPVASLVFFTIVGYCALTDRHVFDVQSVTTYLYLLSGEVILAAGYLFNTYWIGMRNMLYANR